MPRPLLMPFQDEPLNGDTFVAAEFLQLAKRNNCSIAFETGTCLGGTTRFLSENFSEVITVEINKVFQDEAKLFCAGKTNINFALGASEQISEDIIKSLPKDKNIIFFLDSHWNNYCPLLRELEFIAAHRPGKDVIMIHDFKVPGIEGLGFDSYNGADFDINYVKAGLDAIYGADNYNFYYNKEVCAAQRGVLYVEPKAQKVVMYVDSPVHEEKPQTKINLFLQYYNDDLPARQKELEYCLMKNINNHLIDSVFIFLDKDCDIPEVLCPLPQKVNFIYLEKRLTYQHFFEETQKYPHDINVLINTDIYLDSSIAYAHNIQQDECYALLRYNLDAGMNATIFDNRVDSQDTWIFRGAVKPVKSGDYNNGIGADFNLGTAGCDNHIAYLIQQAGYKVKNPCSKIVTYHFHLTEKRNYLINRTESLKPPYLLLKPE